MAHVHEKRRNRRVRRRMRVILDDVPGIGAVTVNLSRSGLCISSDYLAAPRDEIGAALVLPSGEQANFEATVVWVRKARRSASLEEKNLMGLHFSIPPGEEYNALIDQWVTTLHSSSTTSAPAVPPADPQREPITTPASVEPDGVGVISLVGQLGKMSTTVTAEDLAAPSDRFRSTISPTTAGRWAEEASARSVIQLLPPGSVTMGVSLHLMVTHDPPTPVGTRLTTVARVIDVSPDGKIMTLDFKIDDGARVVARGRHARAIVSQPH
jgi:predicted thioesterase